MVRFHGLCDGKIIVRKTNFTVLNLRFYEQEIAMSKQPHGIENSLVYAVFHVFFLKIWTD